MSGTMRCPRRHKHLAPVLDLLGRCGAGEVRVVQNRHVHVSWTAGERTLSITLAIRPKSVDDSARNACKAIRQRYKAIGVEVRA